MTPLYNLAGRTLWVNCCVPWESVVQGLLRMQNASQWRRPITVYLGIENDPTRFLDELHAIQLHSIIRTVRSPVHTMGIGVLLGAEPSVLAAGCLGHRYLLEQALVCCGGEAAVSDLPLRWPQLPAADPLDGLSRALANLVPSHMRMEMSVLDPSAADFRRAPLCRVFQSCPECPPGLGR